MEGTADFTEGDHVPCPVGWLIAFGFYDGATDGLLETRSGRGYRFDFLDEYPTLGEVDSVRMFALRPLPVGVFRRIVDQITPVCPPQDNYWTPSWWDADPAVKAEVDRRVDDLMATAGGPEWFVAGQLGLRQPLRVRRADGITRDREGWAGFFGYSRQHEPG